MSELELFIAALQIEDGVERSAFLDRACDGQPALRQRLSALLDAHARSSSPIDRPDEFQGTAETATSPGLDPDATSGFGKPAQQTEELGSLIAGRYKLVRVIGEGGMGTVYLADQSTPVKRQVALKVIRSGMDSRRILARFDAERQALALMDHPNIARVYDGGTIPFRTPDFELRTEGTSERPTELTSPRIPSRDQRSDGRPFFVMELVKGVALTEFCDTHRLSVKDRLQLFVQVCLAVQHAHQKGIIHRDLKPGNVLVTEVDGRPTPKIIDFGVAKATEQRLTDQSFADTGAIVGTPAYMSPEQADPSSMDIDTRTDVYALGVMLYELLTGSPPIDARQFKRGALMEMLRMVREVEPPRPSTRLTTADALPNIAANRNIDPARLARLLQGELDWVVMKALEKDRSRRYDTANGLAKDIQRYLADEVVEARPPSRSYRLKKFVRRNKGRVFAASLIFLALVGGIIGTSIGLVRAIEAERTALEARNKALASAEAEKAARVKAIEEQARAEKARETTAQQRQLALNTVRDVLLRVDDLMKNDAKLAPLRVEIIRRMLVDVDQIRDHAIKNPLEERTEAIAYSRLGEIYYRTNRIQDSVEWYERAYRILKTLADESPSDVNALRNLAAISHQLADAEWRLGHGIRARELHADGLRLRKLRRQLTMPTTEAIEFAAADLDIADSYQHLAYADLRLGHPKLAVENYLASEAAFVALPVPLPSTIKVRRLLLEIQVRLGDARSKLNEMELAAQHYTRALTSREELLRQVTRPPEAAALVKTDVGQSHMYLGDFLFMMRDEPIPATTEYAASLRIFSEGLAVSPDSLDLRQRVGAAHYRLGATAQHMPALAMAGGNAPLVALQSYHYEESLRLRKELANIDPKDTQSQVELILSQARLGLDDDVENLASRLKQQAGSDPQTLFQLACGYAICSTEGRKEADAFRKRAFETIAELRRNGWKDSVALMTDPDLAPLRDHPTFKEMVEEMENAARAEK